MPSTHHALRAQRRAVTSFCLALLAVAAMSCVGGCSSEDSAQISDASTNDTSGLQTSGFQIPGPPCEVGAPYEVDAFGGDGANRAAASVAPLPNGGVMMAGYADLDANTRSGWVGVVDGFGAPLWESLLPTSFSSGDAMLFDGDSVLLIGSDQDTSRQRLFKLNLADGSTLFDKTFPGGMGSARALLRRADGYLLAVSQLDGNLALHDLDRNGDLRNTQSLTVGGLGSARVLDNGDKGVVVVPTFDMFAPTEVQGGISTALQVVSAAGEVVGTYDFGDGAFAVNHASDAALLGDGSVLISVERIRAGEWIADRVDVIRVDLATMAATSQVTLAMQAPQRSARLHQVIGSDAAFVTSLTLDPVRAFTIWRVDLAAGEAEALPAFTLPAEGFPRGAASTANGLHLVWEDMTNTQWKLNANNIDASGAAAPTSALYVSPVTDTQECVAMAPVRTPDGDRLIIAANCYIGGTGVKLWLQQAACPAE